MKIDLIPYQDQKTWFQVSNYDWNHRCWKEKGNFRASKKQTGNNRKYIALEFQLYLVDGSTDEIGSQYAYWVVNEFSRRKWRLMVPLTSLMLGW